MEFHKICRICLKSDLLVSIFSPTFLLRPIEMVEKLNIFKVDDSLSKFLCQSCLYHIIHISKELTQLQQLALESERQMREYLRCKPITDMKQDIPTLAAIEGNKFLNFSTETTNFCDIFKRPVLQDSGNDDILNDVEIDVSSLTRSEAEETLSEVFVDGQLNCHYDGNANNFDDDTDDGNANVFENVLKVENTESKTLAITPWLNKQNTKISKFPEKCVECGKIFSTKGYLDKHRRIHTGEKPFLCKLCPRQFSYQSNLRLHQKIHEGQRRFFQCEICAKFVSTLSNLKAHRLTHKEERNFQCKNCVKFFKSARELRRHEPIHNTTKSHQCDSCDKSFLKRCYLKAHILNVHRNERKHKCENCDKVFTTISNLKCHMRIHSGEKPFQCKYCAWKFNQTSALMRHIRKKHQNSTLKSSKEVVDIEYSMPTTTLPINNPNGQIMLSHNGINETTINIYNTSSTPQSFELNKVGAKFYETTC